MSQSTWSRPPTLFLTLLVVCCLTAECDASSSEKDLIKFLLDDYNPMVRPAASYGQLINVTFKITLQQIVDLDEKNQLLTTSMYMDWTWQDTYLKWNPDKYGGIKDIRLPAKALWKPDILIYNSAVDAFDQILQTNLVIDHNGTVNWLPPGLFKTTCDVDIRYFPFDEQKCTMKFGTWTYHGGLVDLVLPNTEATLDSYTPSGEWDLLSMTGKRNSFDYDCCPDPFIDVTFTVHMRRRTLSYGFNLILPCLLVCSLAILVFVLPADSGERLTLGITVLLALVVFLQIVADNLPPTDAIPILGKFFVCSIVMVSASVVLTVISASFHHTTSATTNEMPKYIRWLFLYALPKLLRMERPGENSFHQQFLRKSTADAQQEKTEEHMLLAVGSRLDRWKDSPHQHKEMTDLNQANVEISDMLKQLRFITERMHNDDEDEKSALEWRFAAVVLDKFCIWFFVLYFIFSAVFTIGLAPGVLMPLLSE